MSGTPPTSDRRRRRGARRRPGAALAAGLVTMTLTVTAVACGGGGGNGSSDGRPSPTTSAPLDVVVATDPAVPVTVEAGHRFAIVLPADPGGGWRWVVQPFDTARLVALGSEFSDDEATRLAATVATTTSSTAAPGGIVATTTTTTAPSDGPTPTTTTMPPLVQIVSFAGRAPGAVTVSFRATQIAPSPDARPEIVTWTIVVTPSITTTR